jgi:type II secretory pathway pseudopilin PulG
MQQKRQAGYSLLEALMVVALMLLLASLSLPSLKAYNAEYRLVGAAEVFKGEFIRARSIAVMRNDQTAMRFEPCGEETICYSLFVDGNKNGVLTRDIERGIDRRFSGPTRLDASVPGVRVGILPGVPAVPPETGLLDTSDPIRFGRSNMLSFSPFGTATPGTFYLASADMQAAVRVTGGSARIRVLIWRGKKWIER